MAPLGLSQRCLNKSSLHIFLPVHERIIACLLNRTWIAGLVGGRFPSELAGPGHTQFFFNHSVMLWPRGGGFVGVCGCEWKRERDTCVFSMDAIAKQLVKVSFCSIFPYWPVRIDFRWTVMTRYSLPLTFMCFSMLQFDNLVWADD